MRPLGAKRDPAGETRGQSIDRLVGVRRAGLPVSVDLRPFVERIVDQADQGCVGHALGQALRVRARIDGITLDVSDTAIYALAREFENPRAKTLTDDGSYPSKAIDGMQTFGICDRARWPDDVGAHLRVSQDVLEAGSLATVTGVYHITSSGAARKADIMSALSNTHPIVFAMNVDVSYQEYSSGVWRGMVGPTLGGHAQCIVGYTPDGVIVANSWGRGWGENGFSTIAWAWICGPECHDFYTITMSPTKIS